MKIFFNQTSRAVNSGVMQFHMQVTHYFRQFYALNRKNQQKSLGTTAWELWSQVCGKLLC